MSELISMVFDIALSPLQGMYSFFIIPLGFAFLYGCITIIFMLGRKF